MYKNNQEQKILRKRFTPEHSLLRKQIADVLRYIRRNEDFNHPRIDVEVHMEYITTECNGASLSTLIDCIDPSCYDKVFVRGGAGEDYDGYKEGYVEVYTYRKQTDEEYFESLCQYLLPTDYQGKQYKEYLRLKAMFEGGK